jgi:hypothetical protein
MMHTIQRWYCVGDMDVNKNKKTQNGDNINNNLSTNISNTHIRDRKNNIHS